MYGHSDRAHCTKVWNDDYDNLLWEKPWKKPWKNFGNLYKNSYMQSMHAISKPDGNLAQGSSRILIQEKLTLFWGTCTWGLGQAVPPKWRISRAWERVIKFNIPSDLIIWFYYLFDIVFVCKCHELFIFNFGSVDVKHYVRATHGYFLLFLDLPKEVVENTKIKATGWRKREYEINNVEFSNSLFSIPRPEAIFLSSFFCMVSVWLVCVCEDNSATTITQFKRNFFVCTGMDCKMTG